MFQIKSDNRLNKYESIEHERPKTSLDHNNYLERENWELQIQLQKFKELYLQQKHYFQCQQEQFLNLQEKYEESVSKINELEEQMQQQSENQEQTQLCVSLLQDLQGLEYLVNKMKLLIPNKQALNLISQIQKTYEQLRNKESIPSEQQIYHKLLQALDKKLSEIINNEKENVSSHQNIQESQPKLKTYLSQKMM
ncbi:unnamed protein product [Paramecium sonneborni]|uniref:Uncharacterized protein n=1 Tax=Paramecium sonneborni TaxID=65129 RepID=A0A8S1RC51_9CILI|nr:unnamed protein product [Paramecium sonneborni]